MSEEIHCTKLGYGPDQYHKKERNHTFYGGGEEKGVTGHSMYNLPCLSVPREAI